MSIKKYSSGQWVDTPYRKYETATDTITSLPQTIIGDGTALSAWSMKGNMSQSGTPTPSNPIYPTECGDKTANLFSGQYSQFDSQGGTGSSYGYFKVDGDFTLRVKAKSNISVSSNVYLGISMNGGTSTGGYTWAIAGGTSWAQGQVNTVKSTTNGYQYVSLYANNAQTLAYIMENFEVMLNSGSTTLDYEPYGYKIPISLNNVTYPIYISEPLRKSLDGSNLYDTIESNGTLTRRVDANGDALATPTTEQVTVPTLTTTGTAEQFNVLTTLAPSEVSLTYHGWHEHEDTKFTT